MKRMFGLTFHRNLTRSLSQVKLLLQAAATAEGGSAEAASATRSSSLASRVLNRPQALLMTLMWKSSSLTTMRPFADRKPSLA